MARLCIDLSGEDSSKPDKTSTDQTSSVKIARAINLDWLGDSDADSDEDVARGRENATGSVREREKRPLGTDREQRGRESRDTEDDLVDTWNNFRPRVRATKTQASPVKTDLVKALFDLDLEDGNDVGNEDEETDAPRPKRNLAVPTSLATPESTTLATLEPPSASTDGSKTKTSRTPSPSKKRATSPSKRQLKKTFEESKHQVAEAFVRELDEVITQGRIGALTAATGGIKMEWSKTLNTTAGRAHWKRQTVSSPSTTTEGATRTGGGPNDGKPSKATVHDVRIELATKVIDDEERLLNVLAHEFCHLATFVITGITTNPHGKEFKAWAAQCTRHFGDRSVHVTTKHSYAIDYKYVWMCRDCRARYQRHSKSIHPDRHRCGTCKGVLEQTKPKPRGAGGGGGGDSGPSAYQVFLKQEMKTIRAENPGLAQDRVMKEAAKRWTQVRDQAAERLEAKVSDLSVTMESISVEDDVEAQAIDDETSV